MSPRSSAPAARAGTAAKASAEQVVGDIRRATRKHFSAEDKIRIVLEGLRGEESIAAPCRREGTSRMSSDFVLPSEMRLRTSSRVGWWPRMRVTTTRYSAALAWRLPPRLSR